MCCLYSRVITVSRRISVLVLTALLLLPAPSVAGGQPGPKKNSAFERLIVRAKPGQEGKLRQTLEQRGHKIVAVHPSIRAVTVKGKHLETLGDDGLVETVSPDAIVRAFAAPVPTSSTELNVLRATLGLTAASVTGAGVGVAIIDSGIHPAAGFEGRITAFFEFSDGGVSQIDPIDRYGHGTHVAGLIGSDGQRSDGQYQGVAPAVRLVGLKVLDQDGQGYTSDVIQAIEFAVQYRQALGIDIINLSLGHLIGQPAATDPLVQAVEQAVRAGIIVVTSAGNNGTSPDSGEVGYAGLNSPGNAPSAITVGAAKTQDTAARSDDRVADFSSRGPRPGMTGLRSPTSSRRATPWCPRPRVEQARSSSNTPRCR